MKSTSLHIQGMSWFLLVAYSKMQQRDKLKKGTVKQKRNQSLMMWKTLSLSILQKMRKHALDRMPVELGQPFAIEIRHLIYGSNPPSLQKPGAEMGFAGRLWRTMVSNGVWISSTSQKTDKVFVNFAPVETPPAWDERDRDGTK